MQNGIFQSSRKNSYYFIGHEGTGVEFSRDDWDVLRKNKKNIDSLKSSRNFVKNCGKSLKVRKITGKFEKIGKFEEIWKI